MRSRLAQGFLEQWDGTTFALELGKEDKSLGAPGTLSLLRKEVEKIGRASCRERVYLCV